MSRAHGFFILLLGTGGLLAFLLFSASLRVLSLAGEESGTTALLVARWCLAFFTGSAALDELLLVGFLGLLPAALILGLVSLVWQWFATRSALGSLSTGRRALPARHLATLISELDLTGRVDVVQTSDPMAFCYGLLQPRICVTTGLVRLLTESEVKAVLIHERHHLLSRDPLRVWVIQAISRALFFWPLATELKRGFLCAKEIDADAAVIRDQGSSIPLASALYQLASRTPTRRPSGAVVRVDGNGDIDSRIDHLVDPRRRPRVRLSPRAVVASAAVPLIAIVLLLYPTGSQAVAHAHMAMTDDRSCPV